MTSKRDQRDFTQFLQDILEAIDDIEGFVKGMELNEFSGDKKTIYAVMKALEIMGEATKNLPDTLKMNIQTSHGSSWQEFATK